MAQGCSALAFLLLALSVWLDFKYRIPVLGAFLLPLALAVLVPGLLLGADSASHGTLGSRFLPFHITVALLGVTAFAGAARVGGVYLLMDAS